MIAEHFLVSLSKRPRLRIGVLLDGLSLPRCFEQVVDQILKSNFAAIELLMIHAPANLAPVRPRKSKWRLLWNVLSDSKRRKHLGFAIYSKLDQKYFLDTNHPQEVIDCTEKLSGIESLKITPIAKGFVHRFTSADIEEIRKRDLDVILRFGFNILRGDILTAARCGVWSYHHGDNEFYRGGPPHFWELYEENKLSGAILQVLTEELDAGHVLAKALFSTVRGGISTLQNRFTPYWGAVHLVIQKLYELHNYGWEHLERHSIPNKRYQGRRKIYRTPTNWELFRWLVPTLAAKSARRLARVVTGERIWLWRIALRTGSRQLLHQVDAGDRSAFKWLTPPKGHFHADPFLVEDQGRTWMFFEDYIYCESKAAIVCREVLPNGELGQMRTVLRRPYHLSYPFVFKHDGSYYLIPESVSNRTVELYRATDFPYQWSLEKVLFLGKAVDTTAFIDGDTFWFFTTLQAPAGDGMYLCLFYSDRIDGEWQWHPANPISMDVRDARCGGRVFRHDGKLIRISQDCSGRYGSSFSFREIVTVTKTEYRETLLQTVEPWSKSFWGTHTYDHSSNIEVIDGVTYAPKSASLPSVELPAAEPIKSDVGSARSGRFS
jgi:hypothetical protein